MKAVINSSQFDEVQKILKVDYKILNQSNTQIGSSNNIASWHYVNKEWKLLYPKVLTSKVMQSIVNALDNEKKVRLHLVTNGFL